MQCNAINLTTRRGLLLLIAMTVTANAEAVTSAAFATIDWSTLEITTFDEGILTPLDNPVAKNSAAVSDEHGLPLSGMEQLFAPAYAAHPFYDDNAALAGFDDDSSSAVAGADFGSAVAESVASVSFSPLGWGTALISVAYSIGTEIEGLWQDSTVAGAAVAWAVTRTEQNTGLEDVVFYDEANVWRSDAGASVDAGLLTALFEFEESDGAIYRLDGSASAMAVGTLAAPVPAALPMMLSALGLAGAVTRRHRTA